MNAVVYANTRTLEELATMYRVRGLLRAAIAREFTYARFADTCDDGGTLVCETSVDATTLDRMRCFAKGFVACAKASAP